MTHRDSQSWNPSQYDKNARFVSDLGAPVLALLNPVPGERILDLGCGDGVLTKQLADKGCDTLGVDASSEMVAAARELGVDARTLPGQNLTFDQEFDAVFSNAALHWMPEAGDVADGVFRALKPGGRFVGEFGGQGNVAKIVAAIERAMLRRSITPPTPWYFPSTDEYRSVLCDAGFSVDYAELLPRPTPLPGNVRGWLETFGAPFLSLISKSEHEGFLDEIVSDLKPLLSDDEGNWYADYVRIRFSAHKAAS